MKLQKFQKREKNFFLSTKLESVEWRVRFDNEQILKSDLENHIQNQNQIHKFKFVCVTCDHRKGLPQKQALIHHKTNATPWTDDADTPKGGNESLNP